MWLQGLAALQLACGSRYPPPPETVQDPVVDTLHGVVFTDPYRWLEDQDSPETRAWIAEQNAYAEEIVGESELRAGLEARLPELMDAPGAVYPRRQDEFEYFALRKPGREVGAIYRRPSSGEELPDRLPTALYSSVAFTSDGTGFYYTHRSRRSGPRTVTRGPTIFGPAAGRSGTV